MSGQSYNPSTNSTLPAKNLAEDSSGNDRVYNPSSGDLGNLGIAALASGQQSANHQTSYSQTPDSQHDSSHNSQNHGYSQQSAGSQGGNPSQNSSTGQSHGVSQYNSQTQGQSANDNKILEAQTSQLTQGSEEEEQKDDSKNWKIAAGVGGGILAAAGAAVGGYYLNEKKKASKQKEEEKAYLSNKQNVQNEPSLGQTNKPTRTEGINSSTGSYGALESGHGSGHQGQGGNHGSEVYPTSGTSQGFGGLNELRDSVKNELVDHNKSTGFGSSNSGHGSQLQDGLSYQQPSGSNLGSHGQSFGSQQFSGGNAYEQSGQGQFRD